MAPSERYTAKNIQFKVPQYTGSTAPSGAGDWERYTVKNIQRSTTGSTPSSKAGYWESVRCIVCEERTGTQDGYWIHMASEHNITEFTIAKFLNQVETLKNRAKETPSVHFIVSMVKAAVALNIIPENENHHEGDDELKILRQVDEYGHFIIKQAEGDLYYKAMVKMAADYFQKNYKQLISENWNVVKGWNVVKKEVKKR